MLIAGKVDLAESLTQLAARRPLFHSEADFQFALAWEVQKADDQINVYLESRPLPQKGVHLDLAFERDGQYSAIELKYLTRKFAGEIAGQHYELKNHGAHDFRRYDVVKDVKRVEDFVASRSNTNGAVIVLANDPAYWTPSPGSIANDLAFRIGDGDILEGPRGWRQPPASSGGRVDLELKHRYEMKWSDFGDGRHLRQLIIEVPVDADQ